MFNIHAQTSMSPKKMANIQPYASSQDRFVSPLYGTHLSEQMTTPGLIEFSYEFDFDENGVMFYLGTYGKKMPWKNPHNLGLL